MDGFFARAAVVAERLARRASDLADGLRAAELPSHAAVSQTVAERLGRLAFDGAGDPEIGYDRVSEDAADCRTALVQVAEDLVSCDDALAVDAAAIADELRKLAADALSVTQPID